MKSLALILIILAIWCAGLLAFAALLPFPRAAKATASTVVTR